jgi:hypothetical protein
MGGHLARLTGVILGALALGGGLQDNRVPSVLGDGLIFCSNVRARRQLEADRKQ